MNPLDTDARARLHKVLALLDSQEEGEAMAALRQARRLLREADLSMRELLALPGDMPSGGGSNALMVTSLKAYVEDLKSRLAETRATADAWRERAEAADQSAALAKTRQEFEALKRRTCELEDKHRAELAAAQREILRTEAVKLKAAQDQAVMWRRKAEGLAAAQPPKQTAVPPNTAQPAPAPEEKLPAAAMALKARVAELEKALEAAPRRSNAAKRAAVLGILNDPLTAQQSDREIARQAGVAPQTVANWRRRLREGGGPQPPGERLVRRRGRSFAMRIGNIGQNGSEGLSSP